MGSWFSWLDPVGSGVLRLGSGFLPCRLFLACCTCHRPAPWGSLVPLLGLWTLWCWLLVLGSMFLGPAPLGSLLHLPGSGFLPGCLHLLWSRLIWQVPWGSLAVLLGLWVPLSSGAPLGSLLHLLGSRFLLRSLLSQGSGFFKVPSLGSSPVCSFHGWVEVRHVQVYVGLSSGSGPLFSCACLKYLGVGF